MTAGRLEVFVATRLVNPTNAREHWSVRANRAKAQREAVAIQVWNVLNVSAKADDDRRRSVWRIAVNPDRPKRITLTAQVARKLDTDGLQAALKAIRDGLQDCGLIHHDGPDSGHVFVYEQMVAKPTGVQIIVELA